MDGPGFEFRYGEEIALLKTSKPALYPLRHLLTAFSRVKQPGRAVDHSPAISVEVKNECSYTSAPPVCLHGVDITFLGEFANFRKANVSFVMPVRPNGTTRLPLDEFSLSMRNTAQKCTHFSRELLKGTFMKKCIKMEIILKHPEQCDVNAQMFHLMTRRW